ncbi:MAG: lysophospholipase [Firmicutes bacterium]|nr:lysophospholipase [Bacillota bacterium]
MPLWLTGRTDGHRLQEVAAPDGLPIPVRVWDHPAPEAVVVYLHGQGEHSGPFTAMGDELQRLGLAVLAPDQRGFGLSPAPRGDIDRFERFVEDAGAVVGLARVQYPDRPCFLMGFSMGGHVALRAATLLGTDLAGVVALAPGLKLRWLPLGALARLAVRMLLAPGRPAEWPLPVPVCRHPEHGERTAADESWVRRYTPRFWLAAWRSIRRAFREAPRVRLPVLILVPEHDYLVDSRAAAAYFRRLGSPDREFRVVPRAYHNLVADPEMPDLARQVADWIRARSRQPRPMK